MKKHPLLSFSLQAAALCFLLLLWWSSTLIEQDLKRIRKQLDSLSSRLETLKRKNALITQKAHLIVKEDAAPLVENNLFQEDPFYKNTLPKLLPEKFIPFGTFTSANVGRPENLLPFAGNAEVSSLQGQCIGSLGTTWVGFYERFTSDLARAIEVKENPVRKTIDYFVYLRKDIFWKPLDQDLFPNLNLSEHFLKPHPVTSEDFKFQFDTVMNPNVQLSGALGMRPYMETIEEVEVIDPYTFVVRWKAQEINGKWKAQYSAKGVTISFTPLASFLYKYYPDGTKIVEKDEEKNSYKTSSLYAQALFQHFASQYIPSCGVWEFEGISDEGVSFLKNSQYPYPLRALFEKQRHYFKSSNDNLWKAFQALQIDVCSLAPDQELELKQFLKSKVYMKQKEQGLAINRLDYPQRAFTYIGWNQKTHFFADKNVRTAMTLAINRKRIIDQFISGKGIETTGSFFIESSSYNKDVSPYPYDPFKAEALLDEAGWLFNPSKGVREKKIEGATVPFSFILTYYVKNSTAKAIVEFVSSSLKRIGVECIPLGLDVADLSKTVRSKEFNAVMLGWMQGLPPEDPRQLWHSSYADLPGSSNYIGFKDKKIDEIIEELTYEDDTEKRTTLYHEFHAILYEEQPYTFLYVPITTFLWRDTIKNVFIPQKRQDLIPGAQTIEPVSSLFYKAAQ